MQLLANATAVIMALPVSIRLISHNIRYATSWPTTGEALWADRKHLVVAQYLYETRYVPEALLGLQEVLHSQLLDLLDGLNEHSEPTDWEYIGVGADDGKEGGQYNPILYRSSIYRLVKFTNVWLSETPSVPSKGWDAPYWNRVLTVGEFEHRASGRLICARNTHLDDLGVVARQRSAQLIVDRSKGFLDRGYAVTLTGDFNSQPNEDAYQTVQNSPKSPFVDATTLFSETRDTRKYGHVKTYTGFDFGEHTKKRIDYLFLAPRYSSPWNVKGVGVLETRFDDGVADSDHRPAVTDVILK